MTSLPQPQTDHIRPLANALRALAFDAVEAAQSGHPGMPMGMADVATVLYSRHLTFYAARPDWADRDRVILSGGHGSMLLYGLNYLTGYQAMTIEEIKRFRQLHSRTPGHPEHDVQAGIEMTTGPLGQGLATAVGMAVAERHLNATFGDDLVSHRTYVFAGDGDLQEGISHEAAALAGHLRLARLIVLYDDNGISIDGPTALSFTEDVAKRFVAYGWAVQKVDGHDPAAVDAALDWAKEQDRPVLLACKTMIGFGAPHKAGSADCHGAPLGAEEVAHARKALNWPHPPFVIPDDILTQWRAIGARCATAFQDWEDRLAKTAESLRQRYLEQMAGVLPPAFDQAIQSIQDAFRSEKAGIATRKASQRVLEKIVPALPGLVGGSADLTGSNLTMVAGNSLSIQAGNYAGRYIHYGVREHGMAAMMNGMALHGGILPYGGTFLSFADYCRPAIRLAALMACPSIFVMTHDSIGLGEDGPTHQPVEHLAALRAIPNLRVLRPGDAIETAECWEIALRDRSGPSLLALTRQNLKLQRTTDEHENRSARGGYTLIKSNATPRVVLFATGSEVELAVDVWARLEGGGIPANVVSLPCFELFFAQDDAYRATVLGPQGALKVGIEAAIEQGWSRIIGSEGLFFGLHGFGLSGPYKQLYAHFGLTAEGITEAIRKKIG